MELKTKLKEFEWKFQKQDKTSGCTRNFIIKHIPEERCEDAADFMAKYFLTGEAMCECKKIAENEKEIQEAKLRWNVEFTESSGLACFEDRAEEIIAVSLLRIHVDEKEGQEVDQPRVSSDIGSMIKIADEKFNVFQHYNVEKCLHIEMLAVHSNYRGMGIATEFFQASKELLKQSGLSVVSAACTG